jgi:hypothetical protein
MPILFLLCRPYVFQHRDADMFSCPRRTTPSRRDISLSGDTPPLRCWLFTPLAFAAACHCLFFSRQHAQRRS